MIMNVNRDDRIATRELRRHQSGEADAADAEHDEAVTRSGLHRIQHCTSTSLDAAGERAQPVEGRIAPDLHDKARVGDGVRCEGGLLEECAIDWLVTLGHKD